MRARRFSVILIAMIMVIASVYSGAVFAAPETDDSSKSGSDSSSQSTGTYNNYSTYRTYNTYSTYSTYSTYTTGYSLSGSLSVVFTGDIHSHIKSENGKGGIGRLASYIKEQQSKDADTFIVDAGNFSMGTPFQAVFMNEALELRSLGLTGCDVTTLGANEFAYGMGALADMLDAARKKAGDDEKLPEIVCSNIDWEKTLKGPDAKGAAKLKKAMEKYDTKTFKSVTKGQKKIVAFGITAGSAAKALEEKGIYFKDPVQAAKDTVKRLKKKIKDIDMIVCLGQLGAGSEEKTGTGESEKIAAADKDIDIIVIGNSGKTLRKKAGENGVRMVSAGNDGSYAGVITYKEKTWGKEDYKHESWEVRKLDSDVAEDAAAKEAADSYEEILNSEYFEKHGYEEGEELVENDIAFSDIEKFRDSKDKDPFGDLLADSYIYGAKKAGVKNADVAIASSKAVDAGLGKGKITVTDVFDMSSGRLGPDGTVGSALVRVYMTGKDLKNIAEARVSVIPDMKDVSFYMKGIKYSYNTHRMPRNKVFKVTDDKGKKLSDDRIYTVITDREFLDIVADISKGGKGMTPIQVRDKKGEPADEKNWDQMTIKKNGAELKTWQAVADKLDSFDGKIPGTYSKARSEATESTSFSPKELFGSLNRAGLIALCIALVIVLAVVLIIILLVSRHRKSYASRMRRETHMFRDKRHGRGSRRGRHKNQKNIFSKKKNRFF